MREILAKLRRPPAWVKVVVTGICAAILVVLIVNIFSSAPYTGPWLWVALGFALISGAFGWTYRMPSLRGRRDDDDEDDEDDDTDTVDRPGAGKR